MRMKGDTKFEGWGWCYVDEVFLDLGDDTTPQRGPIPKFV
jgi:hypothetical protein